MKKSAKRLILLSLTLSLGSTALGDTDSEKVAFMFDNGAGLSGTSTYSRFNSRHGEFYPHSGTPISQFTVHRDYGATALHYGGIISDGENHYYGGASLGPATLAYFEGEAESFSKAPNPLYDDLNQYFFHGGTRSLFTVQGVAADVALNDKMSTQFAMSNVSAPGFEDRHGYYAGIANRRFSAGLFQFDRGGAKVGQGLNLGFSGRRLDLEYQEIRSEYGAQVRRVALEWSATPRGGISIEFEQARNDLYSDADEQRIMIRFRKRLGRIPVFNAAESGENGEEKKDPGFNKAVGIGVGLGIAAVAISSGGGSDGAKRFAVRNDAAFDVFNDINPVSVRENREYGGWVYRNADNTFGYTPPVVGTVANVNIGNPFTAVPMGTIASASYHTHGGPDPRFDNENFSPQDIRSDRLAGTDGYLGTPAGFMKLHDVQTGNITVVGRINN